MISEYTVKNYKALRNLRLEDMSRMTLIAGKNNAGKSSVLESIFFMIDFCSPEVFFKLSRFRNKPIIMGTLDLWEYLFSSQDPKGLLEIAAVIDGKHVRLECEKRRKTILHQWRVPRRTRNLIRSYVAPIRFSSIASA